MFRNDHSTEELNCSKVLNQGILESLCAATFFVSISACQARSAKREEGGYILLVVFAVCGAILPFLPRKKPQRDPFSLDIRRKTICTGSVSAPQPINTVRNDPVDMLAQGLRNSAIKTVDVGSSGSIYPEPRDLPGISGELHPLSNSNEVPLFYLGH